MYPFWNEATTRWSREHLPDADRIMAAMPISSIPKTCFDAYVHFSAYRSAGDRPWRAILESGLPAPPPPPIPRVKSRTKKKTTAPDCGQPTAKKKSSYKAKTPKLPGDKTKRLRIYPTKVQKDLLSKWMGTVRWTYNQAVDAISKDTSLEKNEKRLRSIFVTKKAIENLKSSDDPFDHDFSWVLETPSFARNRAIADAVMAYQSNRAKQAKQGKRYKFDVKFRSRERDAQQSIAFSSADWGRTRGKFAGLLSHKVLRCCQMLPDKLDYGFEIVHIRTTSKFYLCLPGPLEIHARDPLKPFRAIALDPGVRTFQAGFDSDGNAFEFGVQKDERRIFRLCQHLDQLESRRTALQPGGDLTRFLYRHKKRANMKRAAARLRERIRNIVNELHRKTSLWLCCNYDAVLIPEFQTARMAKRGEERCIGSKTARMMYTWAHYRFRQHLMHKSRASTLRAGWSSFERTTRARHAVDVVRSTGNSEVPKCSDVQPVDMQQTGTSTQCETSSFDI